jgi:hypothetical protein
MLEEDKYDTVKEYSLVVFDKDSVGDAASCMRPQSEMEIPITKGH